MDAQRLPALREALRRVPILASLSTDEIDRLLASARVEKFARDQTVFEEGDQGDGMWIVLSGSVRIFRNFVRKDEDTTVDVRTFEAGSYFGELALYDSSPRSASVAAMQPTELLFIGKEPFIDVLARSPEHFRTVLAEMSARVRTSTETICSTMLQKLSLKSQYERERYRALAQLVAGIAHELNTPLGIVGTATALLIERLTDPSLAEASDETRKDAMADVLEAARLIQGNLQRAAHLVESFKSLSVKQVTDRRQELDLVETLREIVTLFGPRARRAKLEVELIDRLDPSERLWVGYAGYLTQIVLNLLTNIERYAYPAGIGGKAQITVRATVVKDVPSFELVVKDFGAGIAPEVLPRVFEAFYTTGRDRGGTGLGLSIVQGIVTDALRGTINVESTIGQGTAFSVTFPRTVRAADEHEK